MLFERNHHTQLSSDLSFEHEWSELNRVKQILCLIAFHFVAIREHSDKEEDIKADAKKAERSHWEDGY